MAVTDDNKRKKAPEPPKNSEHLNRMKYFIGSWKAKAEDGGTTTWTFTWGRNKNFIENEIVEKDSAGKLKLANKGMLSWDNNAKRIINRCLDEAGNPQNFYWRQENDEAWTTWRIGAKNEWPVVIIDENTWRMGNEKQRQVFTRD